MDAKTPRGGYGKLTVVPVQLEDRPVLDRSTTTLTTPPKNLSSLPFPPGRTAQVGKVGSVITTEPPSGYRPRNDCSTGLSREYGDTVSIDPGTDFQTGIHDLNLGPMH